jgi:hypothetical protein
MRLPRSRASHPSRRPLPTPLRPPPTPGQGDANRGGGSPRQELRGLASRWGPCIFALPKRFTRPLLSHVSCVRYVSQAQLEPPCVPVRHARAARVAVGGMDGAEAEIRRGVGRAPRSGIPEQIQSRIGRVGVLNPAAVIQAPPAAYTPLCMPAGRQLSTPDPAHAMCYTAFGHASTDGGIRCATHAWWHAGQKGRRPAVPQLSRRRAPRGVCTWNVAARSPAKGVRMPFAVSFDVRGRGQCHLRAQFCKRLGTRRPAEFKQREPPMQQGYTSRRERKVREHEHKLHAIRSEIPGRAAGSELSAQEIPGRATGCELSCYSLQRCARKREACSMGRKGTAKTQVEAAGAPSAHTSP